MKMTIDAGMALEMFKSWNRDYFTYEALETLINYYDEIDPDMEFDAIAICCDWNEYGDTPCLTWEAFISDYSCLLENEYEPEEIEKMTEEEKKIAICDALEDRTTVIHLSDSVLVEAF